MIHDPLDSPVFPRNFPKCAKSANARTVKNCRFLQDFWKDAKGAKVCLQFPEDRRDPYPYRQAACPTLGRDGMQGRLIHIEPSRAHGPVGIRPSINPNISRFLLK